MNRSTDQQTVAFQVGHLEFVGEQDGPPENLLKIRVVRVLKKYRSVLRAYLAVVRLDQQTGVALCVRSSNDREPKLVEDIGAAFAGIFSSREHLDILFLDDPQEVALSAVCQPFYLRQS